MIIFIFCGYLLLLLLIGVYCMRKNATLEDFILGGRRLGPWVTAISAQASDMSSWLLIGLPGVAYAAGFSILWTVVGCTLGTVFNWIVIAPRIREIAGRYDCLTVPDILEAKLGNGRNPAIRIVSVLFILIFYTTYISAQFIAAGKVFETTFASVEMPWGEMSFTYTSGLLIGGAVIIAYTIMGGFLAVSYTDLLQGILMVTGIAVLPIVGIASLPEGRSFFDVLHDLDPAVFSLSGGKAGASLLFGVVIGGLAWGLGYPGQPHIVSRFMALQDPKQMKRAAVIGIAWVVIALTGAFFVGILGIEYFGSSLADKDTVMPLMARKLLPAFLEGILISAAVAAMMSTVDSQMVIAVGALERDILEKLCGVKLSGKRAVYFGRCVTFALGAAGVVAALSKENVFEQVLDAWGGLAAGLGPAVVLTLLWKRAHRTGIFCGMIAGGGLVIIWKLVDLAAYLPHSFRDLGSLETGFFLNLLVAMLLSFLLNRKRGENGRPS